MNDESEYENPLQSPPVPTEGGKNTGGSLIIENSDRYTVKWEGVNAWAGQLETGGGKAKVETNREVMRQILKNSHGQATPGSITALMGPSGSGKTTLLSILGGRKHTVPSCDGKVLYNNDRLTKKLKKKIGFVKQSDILIDVLTVRESLVYTAFLKLPDTMTREEKELRAERAMKTLNIIHVQDTLVGGTGAMRGVSGGERKRVSIAIELLTNPSVIFLDEPTSGLDSTIALQLMVTLKKMAEEGRTILTSIHQPASRVFILVDYLLLLAEGKTIYQGKRSDCSDYFSKECGGTIPFGVNIADYILDVANGLEGVSLEILEEKVHANLSSSSSSETDDDASHPNGRDLRRSDSVFNRNDTWPVSWWTQFAVLLSRSQRQRRFEIMDLPTSVQFICVTCMVGMLWFGVWLRNPFLEEDARDAAGMMFLSLAFLSFTNVFSSLFTFVVDKEVMFKERDSGMYQLSAYFFAKSLADLPCFLLWPLMFIIATYLMAGFPLTCESFAPYVLVCCLCALTAQSCGLLIGSAVLNMKRAQKLAAVYTLLMLISSGYLVADIPPWIEWIQYISYIRYNYHLLLRIVFKNTHYTSESYAYASVSISHLKDLFGTDPNQEPVEAMLGAFLSLIVYRFLAYLALRWGRKLK